MGAALGPGLPSHGESNFVFMKFANILTTSHLWPSSVLTISLKNHSDGLRSSSPKSQEECQASSTIHTVILRCSLDLGLNSFPNKAGFLWSEGNWEGSTLRMLLLWVTGSYEHLGLGERSSSGAEQQWDLGPSCPLNWLSSEAPLWLCPLSNSFPC